MRRTISYFTFSILFFFSISICNAQGVSEETAKKLDEISDIIEEATINGDFQSTLKFYTNDVIVTPDFNPAIRGVKSLEHQYKMDKNKDTKYLSFTGQVEKRWMCGSEIFERGTFAMAVKSKNSSKPRAYYGSYFQIWEAGKNDSYKIKYTIWNLDFNPCG